MLHNNKYLYLNKFHKYNLRRNRMNKCILTAILAISTLGNALYTIETKQQKIEQLFELTTNKQAYIDCYKPIFANANIVDETVMQSAMDAYFTTMEKTYIAAYDQLFSEATINDMVEYHQSATGKRITETEWEVAANMQKAYGSIMTIIQETLAAKNSSVESLAAKDSEQTAKQQKIETLFALTSDKNVYMKAYEPVFASMQITDANVKQTIIDAFFLVVKEAYIAAYDKFFSEDNIDAMLIYNNSATGKRFIENTLELGAAMQKAYSNIMIIIQDLVAAQEKAAEQANPTTAEATQTTTVINFSDIAKGKTDDEARALFNQAIQHEGVTVVKFSAVWCGPCKAYAPLFNANSIIRKD